LVVVDIRRRFSSLSETQTVAANTYFVKLIGVLASAAGKRELELQSPSRTTVSEMISALLHKVGNNQFRDFLVDSATQDPRPNVIILLNDQDMNIFHGLKTILEPGTNVTIIPVAHGG